MNYESESFESSNTFWKEVSSQNRLGCCSSWFKFIASGKQDVQSLIDPIVQKRPFVLFEIEKIHKNKMWISCRTLSRGIQNMMLILARKRDFDSVNLSRVTRRSGNTNPRKKMMNAEISAIQRNGSCWPGVDPSFEICFSDSRGGAISALTVVQGHLCGPNTPICARNSCFFVKISANQWVASAAPSRMPPLEIGFSVLHGGSISTLAVSQGHISGPDAPIRPREAMALSRYPRIKGSLPLSWAGCSNSKSASQTCMWELFRPLQSLQGISAVPAHQSAPKKSVALSTMLRYPRIKASRLLRWAGCSHSKSASQTRAAQRFRPLPSLKGILAVAAHQSAPEKAVALSRYPRIKVSLLLKIGFSDSFGGTISALAVSHLGGSNAPISTQNRCGFAEISANQEIVMLPMQACIKNIDLQDKLH